MRNCWTMGKVLLVLTVLAGGVLAFPGEPQGVPIQPGEVTTAIPSPAKNDTTTASTITTPTTITTSSETPITKPTKPTTPPTPTTTPASTTTPIPPHTTNATTTVSPSPTTTKAPPPPPSPTPTPKPTAAPASTTSIPVTPAPKGRHFDGLSFMGGIILTTCLIVISVGSYKFYKIRTEQNYRTL